MKEGKKEISPHVQAQQLPCCADAAKDTSNVNPHAVPKESTSSCFIFKDQRLTVLDLVLKRKKAATQN